MGENDDGWTSEGESARPPIRSAEFSPEGTDLLDAVTELLSGELESSPLELTPPLGQVVDWDAVVALLGRPGEAGTADLVRFDYLDYEVEIRGSGSVSLFDSR